jgi:hypothetical protein
MTKEKFKEYEKVCKDLWKELSKKKNLEKSKDQINRDIYSYNNLCPACEIASRISQRKSFFCMFCPIDVWRKKALAEPDVDAVCLRSNNAYGVWANLSCLDVNSTPAQRLAAALKISKYKWTYLKEYKNI